MGSVCDGHTLGGGRCRERRGVSAGVHAYASREGAAVLTTFGLPLRAEPIGMAMVRGDEKEMRVRERVDDDDKLNVDGGETTRTARAAASWCSGRLAGWLASRPFLHTNLCFHLSLHLILGRPTARLSSVALLPLFPFSRAPWPPRPTRNTSCVSF